MRSRELKLGGGARKPDAGAADAVRAFKSVEDVVRSAFRTVTKQVLAETNDYGEGFWGFPYVQPSGSLGSPHAYGTLLSEAACESNPKLEQESRERLGSLYDLFMKAGKAVPDDFSKLARLMSDDSLAVENTWFLPIREKRLSEEVVARFLVEMGWALEEALDFSQDDIRYLAICAACALCGETQIRSYLRKKAERRPALRVESLLMPNDPLTKAMFGRGENHLSAYEYMSGSPRKVRTGKNISATILLENDFEVTDAFEAYQLNDVDRFWLEAVCSIAKEGHTEITGYDILKVSGFSNPYSKSMQKTMRGAFTSINKAVRTRILIDTTDEHEAYSKKRGVDIRQALTLNPIVDAKVSIMSLADGSADFSIKLNVDETGDPISALPLARYATDKRQLISASCDDFDFKSIRRMTLEHRRMWRYVVRRITERGTSNTILFETMFKELSFESITRQKKSNLLEVLRTMLEERKDDLERLGELEGREFLDKTEESELDSLKSRKLVSSFKFAKKGRSLHSVTICFN